MSRSGAQNIGLSYFQTGCACALLACNISYLVRIQVSKQRDM